VQGRTRRILVTRWEQLERENFVIVRLGLVFVIEAEL
jgi:hypothetical protein